MAKRLQQYVDEARRKELAEWNALSEEQKMAAGGRMSTVGGSTSSFTGPGGGFAPSQRWTPYTGRLAAPGDRPPQFHGTDWSEARQEDIARTQAEWSANVPQGYTRSFGAQVLGSALAGVTGKYAGLEAQENIARTEWEAREAWKKQQQQFQYAQLRQSGQLARRELKIREESLVAGAKNALSSLGMRQMFGIFDRWSKGLGRGRAPAQGAMGGARGGAMGGPGQNAPEETRESAGPARWPGLGGSSWARFGGQEYVQSPEDMEQEGNLW